MTAPGGRRKRLREASRRAAIARLTLAERWRLFLKVLRAHADYARRLKARPPGSLSKSEARWLEVHVTALGRESRLTNRKGKQDAR